MNNYYILFKRQQLTVLPLQLQLITNLKLKDFTNNIDVSLHFCFTSTYRHKNYYI